MCEDCGAALCSECLESRSSEYIVCSDCHHTLGFPVLGEKFEECPQCESEQLSKGRKTMDICPRCHSSRVVLLEDRRRSLALDMRHAIMTIQYGHTKLREFTNKLVSAKRLLVSLRMANFLHYRWIEEKIEGIQNELTAIKNRISSQAEIIAKRMAAETKNFIDYNQWNPTQFPFIEGITNRITEMGIYYKQNVDESLEPHRNTLKEVRRQLDGLDYYKGQFSTFYEHGQLSVGELPVCALPEIKIAGSDFLKNDKALGTLFITNKRLLFIAETGRVRKKMETIFDFPLIYLKSVEEDGRLRKRLVLKLKQGEIRATCSDQTKRVLPDYIEIARKFDKYIQTDMQRVRKIEQTDISTSDVRLKIEGMVYSLLSTNDRSQYDDERTIMHSGSRPGVGDWRSTPVRRNPYDIYYRKPESFRDELDRVIGQYDQTKNMRPNYDISPRLHSLQRDAASISNAIRDSVHMLRSGQLVAEDFIRRYRDLMRDSYHNRREIERITRETRDKLW
jgi:transposase-like protein